MEASSDSFAATEEVISILRETSDLEPLTEVAPDDVIPENSPISNEAVTRCLNERCALLKRKKNVSEAGLFTRVDHCEASGTGGERYSNSEKIRIVEFMAEESNACQAQRKFRTEFSKRPPSTKTIRALYKRFKQTGTVGRKPYSQRFRPKTSEEVVSRVKDYFRKNPDMSTRQGAKELNLCRSTTRKIIQELTGREGGQIKRNRSKTFISKTSRQKCKNSAISSTIHIVKEDQPNVVLCDEHPNPFVTHKSSSSKQTRRSILGSLLFCLDFAAQKHKNQIHKEIEFTQLLSYPIAVANILVQEGGIDDVEVIQAAILQKSKDSSETYLDEIASCFSPRVATIVAELLLDRRFTHEERRVYELQNASKKTYPVQLIRMAAMINELRDYGKVLPPGWTDQIRFEYFLWAKQVVQHYYSSNFGMASSLQSLFQQMKV